MSLLYQINNDDYGVTMTTNMKFLIANAFLAGVTIIAVILTLSQGNPAVAATATKIETTPITLTYLSYGDGNGTMYDANCGSTEYLARAARPNFDQGTLSGAKLSTAERIYRCRVSFKVVK
jgi:hypothetical protein